MFQPFSRSFDAPSPPIQTSNTVFYPNGVPITFHNGMAYFPSMTPPITTTSPLANSVEQVPVYPGIFYIKNFNLFIYLFIYFNIYAFIYYSILWTSTAPTYYFSCYRIFSLLSIYAGNVCAYAVSISNPCKYINFIFLNILENMLLFEELLFSKIAFVYSKLD